MCIVIISIKDHDDHDNGEKYDYERRRRNFFSTPGHLTKRNRWFLHPKLSSGTYGHFCRASGHTLGPPGHRPPGAQTHGAPNPWGTTFSAKNPWGTTPWVPCQPMGHLRPCFIYPLVLLPAYIYFSENFTNYLHISIDI